MPGPISEEVGFLGVMQEKGKPIELALRLKIRNGKITEAEHLIARNLMERNLANLKTPRPGLLATLPPDQRIPRDQDAKIGASYYEALVTADANHAPFADDFDHLLIHRLAKLREAKYETRFRDRNFHVRGSMPLM